jgi:hypothetical protein
LVGGLIHTSFGRSAFPATGIEHNFSILFVTRWRINLNYGASAIRYGFMTVITFIHPSLVLANPTYLGHV